MRLALLVLLPITALFLQSTFFQVLPLGNTIPDLLLILTVCHALLNGAYKGTIFGMICGLLEDLYVGRFVGINAISKGLTAYLAGSLQGSVFKENILVGVIGVAGGTMVNFGLLFFLSLLSFDRFNLDYSILLQLCYQLLYNILLSIPTYILYYNSSHSGWLREAGDY